MNAMKLNGKTADYESIKWVGKAVSIDNAREAIQYISIEKNKDGTIAVATDGRRLHCAKLENKIKPGLYKIEACNAKRMFLVERETGLTFPDWLKVIPPTDMPYKDWPKFTTGNGNKSYQSLEDFRIAVFIHGLCGALFNLGFILDCMYEPSTEYGFFQADAISAVRIQNGEKWTRQAVVMSCRVE